MRYQGKMRVRLEITWFSCRDKWRNASYLNNSHGEIVLKFGANCKQIFRILNVNWNPSGVGKRNPLLIRLASCFDRRQLAEYVFIGCTHLVLLINHFPLFCGTALWTVVRSIPKKRNNVLRMHYSEVSVICCSQRFSQKIWKQKRSSIVIWQIPEEIIAKHRAG